MNRLTTFTIVLLVTFAVPWLVLIVLPHSAMSDLGPRSYSEDDLEFAEGTAFPPGRAGRVADGSRIYAENGCAYCHTQMIRPTYIGNDHWHEGWAGRGKNWDGDEKAVEMRSTVPEDYLGEKYAHLGFQRNGPDLSNVGWRIKDASWHYKHLYAPRSVRDWSNMPAFKGLFEERKISSSRSADALDLPEAFSPGEDIEVVPTGEAKALVSYLMSLKKDYELPGKVQNPSGGSDSGPATASTN